MYNSRSEIRAYRIKNSDSINTAKVLIIGDRPGPKATCDVPFYGDKFSGGFLNKLLDASGICEDVLFWMNAYTKDGRPSDSKILNMRTWIAVIALGNNAENWLIKSKCLAYVKFEHPQAHRRFKSKQIYPLIPFLQHIV